MAGGLVFIASADHFLNDAGVACQEIGQDLGGRRPLPLTCQPPRLDQSIGHLGHRGHDDHRRSSAGMLLELRLDDLDDAGHRVGIRDRGAAELHDDVHRKPSRCMSSAFRTAAPAAPRIVLWPSATNL